MKLLSRISLSAALVAGATLACRPALATSLNVKAAAIKGDGEISLAARKDFFLVPYDPFKLADQVIEEQKIGPAPRIGDYVKQREEWWGTWEQIDPLFYEDLEVWQAKFESAIEAKLKEKGRVVSFKTNLNGEGRIEAKPGSYLLLGSYQDEFSELGWTLPIKLEGKTVSLELSNDNAVATDLDGLNALLEILEGPGYVAPKAEDKPALASHWNAMGNLAFYGGVAGAIGLLILPMMLAPKAQ